MDIVKRPQTNRELGQPRGWDNMTDVPCDTLPIIQQGSRMYSYWKPTFQELIKLQMGGQVRLCVYGHGHPPVSLDIVSENEL